MNEGKVINIAKYQLIKVFNERFYNREFYTNNKTGIMLLDYETNRENKEFLFEDVLDFCLKTDVCKSLNLSFLDIMSRMDLASYSRLKEAVLKENERKAAALEKSRKESEFKTQQLIGDSHARRTN